MATLLEIQMSLMAGYAYQSTRPDENKLPIPDGWVKIKKVVLKTIPSHAVMK